MIAVVGGWSLFWTLTVMAPLCGWLASESRRRARRNPLQALGRVVGAVQR